MNGDNSLPRVLIVDDEPRVLRSLKAALKAKFDVSSAEDAAQAKMILLESERFDVIVSDERMPNCPGHTFLNWAKENYPDSVRILLTSSDISVLKESIEPADVYTCLQKPWNIKELQQILHQAVTKSRQLADQIKTDRRGLPPKCSMAVLDLGKTYVDSYMFLEGNLDGVSGIYFFDYPEEVISILSEGPGIGILLIDLSIGVVKSAKLIQDMNEKFSSVSIILTGEPAAIGVFMESFENPSLFDFITKPVSLFRLKPKVLNAVEKFVINHEAYSKKMGSRRYDRRRKD